MPEQIRDGKGRGYLVSVSEHQRLLTAAVTIPLRTHLSAHDGQSYTCNTGVLTLSATDTWHWVLYWAVTATTKNMFINDIEISWNGGSTNFNRPLQVRNVQPAAGVPTGNQSNATFSQNNKLLSNVAEVTGYKWDGVGAGMTDSTGPAGGDTFHAQGTSNLDRSFVITGLGAAVGLEVKSTEIGDFNIGIGVFFADKDAEL
jgi:hypothetical protein